MNERKKKSGKRNIITFEAEDGAVLMALTNAELAGRGEKSRMINEAIRVHGGAALVNVINEEIETARRKLKRVQDAAEQ